MNWTNNHSHQEGDLEFPPPVDQGTLRKYRGGLALAVELARISGLKKLCFAIRTWSCARMSMFGLLVMGRSAYEDIVLFRKDELFRSVFGLERIGNGIRLIPLTIPSPI
jgi:hypothetical protein